MNRQPNDESIDNANSSIAWELIHASMYLSKMRVEDAVAILVAPRDVAASPPIPHVMS